MDPVKGLCKDSASIFPTFSSFQQPFLTLEKFIPGIMELA